MTHGTTAISDRKPDRHGGDYRAVDVPASFSLAITCAPVAWARGRWPQWAWREDELLWAGRENGRLVWRGARSVSPVVLEIRGDADPAFDRHWATAVLGVDRSCPLFADPVIETLRERHAGLRPFAAGSLFDGLLMSTVGQSITMLAAAVVLRRLGELFNPAIGPAERPLVPLPTPDQLARAERADLRATGVTWRRADALIAAGRAFADDPSRWEDAEADIEGSRSRLRALPLVGPWTANAALLWGIAAPDVHVSGDVALLRAARSASGRPDLTMKELDALADGWHPGRAWAARLLWCDLLGTPTSTPDEPSRR